MASGDIITRLLLNTSDFDQKLGKSRKEVDGWSQQITNAGATAGNALKGLAGAAGLAFGAMETFNKVVTANEANNDKWENTVRAMNNSVTEFFSALTTGDFSSFQNGLDGIIQKARDTAEALRQIEDAQSVYGLFASENRAIFNENLLTLRDKTASESAKADARKNIEDIISKQKEESSVLADKALEAVSQIIAQRSNVESASLTEANIKDMLSIALDAEGGLRSEGLESRYGEYVRNYNDLRARYSEIDMQTGRVMFTGGPEYRSELSDLNNQYSDAILYNALWNKVNGDELKQLIGFLQSAYSSRSEIAGMERSYMRIDQSASVSGGAVAEANKTDIISDADIQAFTREVLYNIEQDIYSKFNENFSKISGEEAIKVSKEKIDLGGKLSVDKLDTSMEDFTSSTMKGVDAVSTLGGAISNITGLVDSGAASWISYGTNLLQTAVMAIPAIKALTEAKKQEANANILDMASGAGNSVASVPIAGPILAVAAIASVIAAMASIPQFADGGIVGGNSYYGDKILARLNSGEMVLNQSQQMSLLDKMDRPQQNINITGKLTASGRDLSLILDNYNIYKKQ